MQTSKGESDELGASPPLEGAPLRVPFVSRRGLSDAGPDDLGMDAEGQAFPRWNERAILLLVLLTILLQALAWFSLAGYQLADSVEFMDRAFAVARGETLDTTGAVRSFGFSSLLLPFFAVARWLELEDMRHVVHAVRLFQMALGVGLVLAVTRLGARLAGRQVGLVAGLLVAVNPIFLQYSVDPVSGVAAALLVALSLNILILKAEFGRSVWGGLLLGLAFMMAYQIFLIAVPLVLLLLLRDKFKRLSSWGGALLGLCLALIAQVVLDKLTYGSWGISVSTYLIENIGGTCFSLLASLGMQDQAWVREAYERFLHTVSSTAVMAENGTRGSLQSPFYYVSHLRMALVPPAMALGLGGFWQAWKHINWRSGILLALFVLNVGVMSFKGDKSFRLWLPLLPMIAPLCALGWQGFAKSAAGSGVPWRRVFGGSLLLASLAMGVGALKQQGTRRYGAYWAAMDFVNEQARADPRAAAAADAQDPRPVVAAAYNWAIFCRNSGDLRVQKLRAHIDQWPVLEGTQREQVLAQLDQLDWLIVHGTILRLAPDLTRAINERFEVAASFWDEDSEPSIRDVRVLRRLEPGPAPQASPRVRRLWTFSQGDAQEHRARWGLERSMPRPLLLTGRGPSGATERLILLGYEVESLPGSGFQWITYHWTTDTGFERDYVLVDRVSSLQSPWSWQNNHEPAHGTLPTSNWPSGWILCESYLLVPGSKPFDEEQFEPFGGSYRRGDLLPAALWVRGESRPPEVNAALLAPADMLSGLPLAREEAQIALEEGGLRSPEGYILSADGLLRAGKFLLPVAERWRWPDDGGPGPDDAVLAREHARQELEQAQ